MVHEKQKESETLPPFIDDPDLPVEVYEEIFLRCQSPQHWRLLTAESAARLRQEQPPEDADIETLAQLRQEALDAKIALVAFESSGYRSTQPPEEP